MPDEPTRGMPPHQDDVIGRSAGQPSGGGSWTPAQGGGFGGSGGSGVPAGGSARRNWLIALAVALVALAGAGIGLGLTAGGPTAPSVPGVSGTACPLSGVPAPGGQVPQRPALAVKIDNYTAARPQSGLDKADVVFEEPVEGNITRLVAVFQCQSASLVGPIRSARAIDVQILSQLSKPIFLHVGGIDPVLSLLSGANIYDQDLRFQNGIIQHPAGRVPPYNTYVSTSAGWGLRSNDTNPPGPIFTYSSAAPTGTPTSSIHIPFGPSNNVMWTWNASRGLWMLSYSGQPATVASGAQIAVPNVVVQSVNVTYGPWVEDSASGALEVQAQMTGSGPLTVFRNGVAVNGTWQRSSLGAPTRLLASNGSTIGLQPGETWYEIVPTSVSVRSSP